MHEIHAFIKGKVQGVAYRNYVQSAADTLGIVGWVKNLSDGSVEVLAQGTTDSLKEFIEYLHEGSLTSKVEEVSVDWSTAKKVYDDFSIMYE